MFVFCQFILFNIHKVFLIIIIQVIIVLFFVITGIKIILDDMIIDTNTLTIYSIECYYHID